MKTFQFPQQVLSEGKCMSFGVPVSFLLLLWSFFVVLGDMNKVKHPSRPFMYCFEVWQTLTKLSFSLHTAFISNMT